MIKAVIFDLGGVLIDFPVPKMIEFCARNLGITVKDLVREARLLRKPFQEGTMSENELWEIICSKTGAAKPRSPSLWEDAFRNAYREKADVFSIVDKLRALKYRIGLLSNTEVPSIRCLDSGRYNFDALVYSCVEGVSKPEPEIYSIALMRLGTAPGEAVFVDDQNDNIEAARNLGIHCILFRDSGQLREELARLGVDV
ncbi:MAG: HAD family phosphatase [Syntrophaceae bacterium]